MEFLKKFFIVVLILLTVNLYLPRITFAQQVKTQVVASAISDDITKIPPEIISTPEKDEPGRGNWVWILTGVVVAGIAVAIAAGGGGDDEVVIQTQGKVKVNWD